MSNIQQFLSEYYFPMLYFWIGLAVLVFFVLLKLKTAEYGRFYKKGSQWEIDNKLGWILMEIPTILLLPLYFVFGTNEMNLCAAIFLGIYLLHYIHRTLIFPFRLKTKGKKMPVQIVISAIIFNILNTFFIGYYFGFINQANNTWLISPIFFLGVAIFILGMVINIQADNTLLNLRSSTDKGSYKVPNGFWYRQISCPNYFGEFLEWLGYAVLTFSLPAFAFALWTFANLGPRAVANHKWYVSQFEDYPKNKKAMIPYLF